jgi:polyphosphate kinase 2 (PPK2 family)
MNITKLLKHLRINDPEHFRLASFDPADTGGIDLDKDEAKTLLAADIKRLAQLQKRLSADGHWGVLIVLQGMDAAGKDGVIAHVMSGLNPQGCKVHAFKAPSEEELAHDFPKRTAQSQV